MAGTGIVDWGLGARVARTVGRGTDRPGAAGRQAFELGLARVLAYTGLEPVGGVPAVESVTRSAWIEANLAELAELAAPLDARAAAEVSLPGPFGGIARSALGAAAGVEAGLVVGYSSRRVLGQYQVSLAAPGRPPRLLLLGENLENAARELGADRERFLLWVAIHEQTHSVQFAAVPWLREHVAGLVGRLIETASGDLDLSALSAFAKRLGSDPRRALREALRGELAHALAGPEQGAIVDEIQATMAVIEGYAEHVMDAAAHSDDDLAGMRALMDDRRARRGGLADAIARALGLGMKLRQYELGKAWSDAVAREAGIEGLNRVWDGPDALPAVAELENPGDWLARVTSAQVA